MKTFGYKNKMYLIIIFGLIYNIYLYQQEDLPACETKISLADTITNSDQLNLKDSSPFEIISLK